MSDTSTKPSVIELILDRPKVVTIISLAMVAVVGMITQDDPEMIRYILGGCATLGVPAALFMDR